jgi:hypothetical protein
MPGLRSGSTRASIDTFRGNSLDPTRFEAGASEFRSDFCRFDRFSINFDRISIGRLREVPCFPGDLRAGGGGWQSQGRTLTISGSHPDDLRVAP